MEQTADSHKHAIEVKFLKNSKRKYDSRRRRTIFSKNTRQMIIERCAITWHKRLLFQRDCDIW